MTSAGFGHETGHYKLSVETGDDGRTRIKLTSTNPPRGLDRVLYEFWGQLPPAPTFIDRVLAPSPTEGTQDAD
jgi:hypothetical protein